MVGSDGQDKYDLNQALAKYGIQVNQEIPEYYLKWHKAEGDSNTIMAALDNYYQVREPSLETSGEYQEIYEHVFLNHHQ